VKSDRDGPTEAIFELLRVEIETILRALPEHLQNALPDYLKEDSAAPA
jgi:hypothetical protein